MIRFTRGFALCAVIFTLNGMGAAYGQYTVLTGSTTGGGNIVIGNGTGLGPLVSGDGKLSSIGFDNLTFNAGSFAIGSGTETVFFTTSNNLVAVSGTVMADTGFSALVLTAPTSRSPPRPPVSSWELVGTAGTNLQAGGNGGNAIWGYTITGDLNSFHLNNLASSRAARAGMPTVTTHPVATAAMQSSWREMLPQLRTCPMSR